MMVPKMRKVDTFGGDVRDRIDKIWRIRFWGMREGRQ